MSEPGAEWWWHAKLSSFSEVWQLLGSRAEAVLEDFDAQHCQHLYHDWEGSVACPARNEAVGPSAP